MCTLTCRTIRAAILICFIVLLSHRTSFAGQYDDCTLNVAAGEPAVKPELASINEDVEFNFVLEVIDKNGKKIEVKPSDVKSVFYSLTSDAEKIKSCTPKMKISANKMSASATKDKLLDVTATVNYSVEGDHTLMLEVTVTFKDNSTLSGSCTLTVKVYKATVTVYAKKTAVVIKQKDGENVPFWEYGDVGHSFWEISVSNPQEFLTAAEQVENGGKWGHYPKNDLSFHDKRALNEVDGKIYDDTNHLFDASHSFTIKLNDAKSALAETKQLLADDNLKYQSINVVARSCTGQCVRVANDFAKSGSPDGEGIIWMNRVVLGIPVDVSYSFRNPYHHGLALENLPNQP